MRIKKITSQHRRDFQAVYACQHCGHTESGAGYDDAHFYENVVPAMKCKACGKSGTDAADILAPSVPAYATL